MSDLETSYAHLCVLAFLAALVPLMLLAAAPQSVLLLASGHGQETPILMAESLQPCDHQHHVLVRTAERPPTLGCRPSFPCATFLVRACAWTW